MAGTPGVYTLTRPSTVPQAVDEPILAWMFSQSGEISQTPPSNTQQSDYNPNQSVELHAVQRMSVDSKESFEKVMKQGSPVILEGLDLGRCLNTWTLEYLTRQIGETRKVCVCVRACVCIIAWFVCF